jgi:phytoene synthase
VLLTEGAEPGGEPPASLRAPLAAATRRLLERAQRLYRSGRRGLCDLPWRTAFAIRVAAGVYAEIGAALGRRRFDVFGPRVVVSLPRKLWLVLLAALGAAAEAPRRLGRLGRRFTVPPETRPLRFPDDIPLPA